VRERVEKVGRKKRKGKRKGEKGGEDSIVSTQGCVKSKREIFDVPRRASPSSS
jgi:hypothetical protein